jgi:hypothetical protein
MYRVRNIFETLHAMLRKLSMSKGARTWFERLHAMLTKLSMTKGALTRFETVWSYDVEAIDYRIIFSMKTK